MIKSPTECETTDKSRRRTDDDELTTFEVRMLNVNCHHDEDDRRRCFLAVNVCLARVLEELIPELACF